MPETTAMPPPVGRTPPRDPAPGAGRRFTLDGDAALEERLARLCTEVGAGLRAIVPASRLEGVLLGGGYGRGEGGVRHLPGGDAPYNDLEFYVLVRGPVPWNEWRLGPALRELAHGLTSDAGLEVEFKLTSAAELRRGPVSMFTYDLVQGHRRIWGEESLLHGCGHHARAGAIPPEEATRLLMNRCSGLLFARPRLSRKAPTEDDLDFADRNIAKASLALGDAVLAAHGCYHWSCRERQRRLAWMGRLAGLPDIDAVRSEHARGVAFKLHPRTAVPTAGALAESWSHVARLASRVWLWLESRRLGRAFPTVADYAMDPAPKLPGSRRTRNVVANLRRFGWRALTDRSLWRYPRERLFRALPVLLWQPDLLRNPAMGHHLRRELGADASDPATLEAAYLRLWEVTR
ncbi:MAG TPA: hypothetical protein VL200_00050 [Lacunisphaera sp.]|jgi:hypothetical protein|nr:hypothetical protein [Lacunisphaera sp.]